MNSYKLFKRKTGRSVLKNGLSGVIILGILFIFSSPGSAQSLQTYQEEAAMNNPELRAVYFEYLAALQKSPQVSSLPDPEIGFMYFISPIETRLGPQQARFSVTQMFPWFGTLSTEENAASAKANAAFESFREQRNRLYLRMERLWAELYEADKAITLANENLMIVNTLVDLSLRRYENGLVSQVDVLRAQIEQEDLTTDITLLEENKKVLIARFNELRNASPTAEIRIPEVIKSQDIAYTQEELLQRVSDHNPGIERLRYMEEAGDSQIESARKNGAPSFALGLDYISTGTRQNVTGLTDNGKDAVIARASVKVPLFRNKYGAQIREAELLRKAADEERLALHKELISELYSALRDRDEASRRIELYDQKQIQRVQQAINILMQSYSADNSQFEEILRLQRKLFEYQLLRVKAQADHFKARRYIEYLTGLNNIDPEEL